MEEHIKRVNTGVDTLILNVRYSDSKDNQSSKSLMKSWSRVGLLAEMFCGVNASWKECDANASIL